MCRDIAGPGDLEIVIDSEINQKEKDKDRIVSLTCAKTIKMKNNKESKKYMMGYYCLPGLSTDSWGFLCKQNHLYEG